MYTANCQGLSKISSLSPCDTIFSLEGVVDLQYDYQALSYHCSCFKWGLLLKLMQATLQLLLHWNNLLHTTTDSGVSDLDAVQLRGALCYQFFLGKEGIPQEDWYLFYANIHELTEEPIDVICRWLCDMLIAHGGIQATKDEYSHVCPILIQLLFLITNVKNS